MKYDVFISYSRGDLDKVKAIKTEIEQATGVNCWMDLEGIEAGDKITQAIISAIKQCDTMLFMLSKNSMISEWTLDELDFAKKEQKRLVIVAIEDVKMSDEFYFHYHKYNHINWNYQPQREKLFCDIRKWAKKAGNKTKRKTTTQINPEAIKEAMKTIREAEAEREAEINYHKGNESYVKEDYEEAVKLYQKAADLGNEDAKKALKEARRKAEEEHQKKLKALENTKLKPIKKGSSDKCVGKLQINVK